MNNILSNEQKRDIVMAQLGELATAAYILELNKKVAELSGNSDKVATANENLGEINLGISVYLEELSKLSE